MFRLEFHVEDIVFGGYGLDDIVVLQIRNQCSLCLRIH